MEEQNISNIEDQEQAELVKLKAIADEYGIKYTHTIGVDTLRARISKHESDKQEIETVTPVSTHNIFANKSLRDADSLGVEYEPNKNIRVRITCLDPDKTAWQGEVLCVGNARGYTRKYILYDKDYMVPQALLDVIKAKTFTKFITTKNKLGHDVTKTVQSPAYNIEYLKDLTADELAAIRQNQLIHNKDD